MGAALWSQGRSLITGMACDMAKQTAGDFTEDEYDQLAELALKVYWAHSWFHAALAVIKQKYPGMEVMEQEKLARFVAARARAKLRHRQQP